MKIPHSSHFRNWSARTGFSLIELLTVMAVLAILATMTISGVGSILKGHALRGATEQTWGAMANARELAVARRTHVALVLTTGRSTEDGDPEKSEAVMLLAAIPPANATDAWTWKPESRWRKLPAGVAIAPEDSSFFVSGQGAQAPGIKAALLKIDGENIEDFSYVIFRPDGSVDAPDTTQPVLGFRRLRVSSTSGGETETTLVLSPESGRPRLFHL